MIICYHMSRFSIKGTNIFRSLMNKANYLNAWPRIANERSLREVNSFDDNHLTGFIAVRPKKERYCKSANTNFRTRTRTRNANKNIHVN